MSAQHSLVGPVITVEPVANRIAELTGSDLSSCAYSQRPGSPRAHVVDVKGSREAVENVMLPEPSFSVTTLVVRQ